MTFHRYITLSISFLACLTGYALNLNDSIPVDTILLDDGSLYVGQIRDSLFNGQGRCIYPDGTVYDGSWTDGLWDGEGVVVYPDGDIYKGSFQNHIKEGKGIYIYGSGARYEGQWKDDRFNGVGKLIFEDGGMYDGTWKDDMKHGYGRLVSPEGFATTGYFYFDEYLGMPFDTEIHRDSTLTDELKSWGFHQEPPRGFSGLSLGITYGSKGMATLTLVHNQTEHFFYGISVGYNIEPPTRGDRSIAIGFHSFANDIHFVGEYVSQQYMIDLGLTFWNRLSIGGAFGFCNTNMYMNCRANGDPSWYEYYSLKYGESYSRNSVEYMRPVYRGYVKYEFQKEQPKAQAYLGYGIGDGLFIGIGFNI